MIEFSGSLIICILQDTLCLASCRTIWCVVLHDWFLIWHRLGNRKIHVYMPFPKTYQIQLTEHFFIIHSGNPSRIECGKCHHLCQHSSDQQGHSSDRRRWTILCIFVPQPIYRVWHSPNDGTLYNDNTKIVPDASGEEQFGGRHTVGQKQRHGIQDNPNFYHFNFPVDSLWNTVRNICQCWQHETPAELLSKDKYWCHLLHTLHDEQHFELSSILLGFQQWCNLEKAATFGPIAFN